MTIAEAKAALVRAHREGGNILRASLAFTRAKKRARRFANCKRCGTTISALNTKSRCMMCYQIVSNGYGNALYPQPSTPTPT